jgi:hypothetical protein
LQNISPIHAKDIVVFIDAITIVFEEASKGGAPLSLLIASIEVGHDHNLPNLALRCILLFSLILLMSYLLLQLYVNLNQDIISAIRNLLPFENAKLSSFRCKISKQNIATCFGHILPQIFGFHIQDSL